MPSTVELEREPAVAGPRFLWNRLEILAALSAVATCVLLLLIPYTPTYFAGKLNLLQLCFLGFWADFRSQLTGFFTGLPQGNLAGEAISSEWSYCALVPFISAWLIWRLWPELRAAPKRGHASGYVLLAVGFLVYLVGFLAENHYVAFVAMELIYAGLIVLFLGWEVMRLVAFPWAFMMFMWPYDFLVDAALQLRLVMAFLSHHTLELIGVPNILQGTAILSFPGASAPFAIDIADPCSGIRSLFALIMISAVYSFLFFRTFWKQALIILLAIPLAILGNLVRLVLLTLGTIHFGSLFAIGTDAQPSWFHEGAGYLVYAVNLGGLVAAVSWLAHLAPEPAPLPASPPGRSPGEVAAYPFRIGTVLALLLGTLLLCYFIPEPRTGSPGVVTDLPDEVGPLMSFPQPISLAELTLLPKDTTFARKTYGPPGGDPFDRILCTIVESGQTPHGLHRPERCLPAQGYIIRQTQVVDVPLKSGHELKAKLLSLEHPYWIAKDKQIIVHSKLFYWYVGDNVTTPYQMQRLFLTNWDLLFDRLNQRWSYVYVLANIAEGLKPHGRNADQTVSLLKAFIRESAPSFMKAEG
jgi:exosortase